MPNSAFSPTGSYNISGSSVTLPTVPRNLAIFTNNSGNIASNINGNTVTVGTTAQITTFNLPDPGTTTSNILVSGTTSFTSGNLLIASGTSGKVIDSGVFPSVVDNSVVNGRLTVTSGDPISPNETASASTVYFTPFKGNRICLYQYIPGTVARWQMCTFTQQSYSISNSSGALVDIYALCDAVTLAVTISATQWASTTARSNTLYLQDGVVVYDVTNPHLRYIGTFCTTSTTTTADTSQKRFIWNMYNQIEKPIATPQLAGPNVNWSYSSTTIRYVNADSNQKIQYIVPYGNNFIHAKSFLTMLNVSGYSMAGIDYGGSLNGASCRWNTFVDNQTYSISVVAVYNNTFDSSGFGLRAMNFVEACGSGTHTAYGYQSADTASCPFTLYPGIHGFLKC